MPKKSEKWDAERLGLQYKSTSDSAREYLDELEGRRPITESEKLLYDQHLAKYNVYDYLWGKSFLENRDLLLIELRKLLENKNFQPPRDAFDPDRFETFRKQWINVLIAEVD